MRNFTPIDYEALGFKSGVEVHQQLLTERKLFCRCPAGMYTDAYDAEILRHMRPTLSELGEYDGTALMEFKTKKEVIYRLKRESVCTYEMDDTPPFIINQDALDIAIRISTLLNLSLVNEFHVTRKQYLDGSIPTGFQRTGLIGIEGHIPISNKTIRIIQLTIEEDSCREVSDIGHQIVFRTDRLGTPLIETVTYPDMKTPWEVAEAIEQIGRLCRMTGQVRRGLGSVRQDVNVSITGGTRIEIKGVSRIAYVPALVHYEALRQKALLEIKAEIIKRLGSKKNLRVQKKDITDLFRKYPPNHEYFRNALEQGLRIMATRVYDIGDLLTYPTQPNLTFADEIKGRIRVIACIDTQPILLHTHSYPIYAGSNRDLETILKPFNPVDVNGTVIVYAGTERDTDTAHKEIVLRLEDAFEGVPSETRQPFPDGTTDFERILPGPDRMYPDTDLPPIPITNERVERIIQWNPIHPWEKEKWYAEKGLHPHVAKEMVLSRFAPIFEEVIKKTTVKPSYVATVLLEYTKFLERQSFQVMQMKPSDWLELFQLLEKKRFYKEIMLDLLKNKFYELEKPFEAILESMRIVPVTMDELNKAIYHVMEIPFQAYTSHTDPKIKEFRYRIGNIMNSYRGQIDGKVVQDLIHLALSHK